MSYIDRKLNKRATFWASVLLSAAGGLAAQEPVPEGGEQQLDAHSLVGTATRSERLAIELPIRTEVLSHELFFSSGSSDLASALDYLPGARVENNCGNCGTTEVLIQGLGSGYNQILFEGQPLFSGLASVYGLEHIPTSYIDRIEVVKGGGSTLYGPGAVAGVINLIPRKPTRTGGKVEGLWESVKGQSGWSGLTVGDWVSKQGELTGTTYVQYNTSSAVDLNHDGLSDITSKDFGTVGTHWWYVPNDDDVWNFHYSYTEEKRRGGNRFDLAPENTNATEQLKHFWHRAGASWERHITSDFGFKLSGSVSHISRDSYYGGVGEVALPGEEGYDPAEYEAAVVDARKLYGFTETTRMFLDLLFHNHLDDHTLSWGVQYQRDWVFDEKRDHANRPLRSDGSYASRGGEDPITHQAYGNLGFYLQDEWDPSVDWTIIGGIRADRNSTLNKWIFSPRVGARYNVSNELTARASLTTGFRAPEVFDEDFHVEILADPTRTRNSAGLKEERSLSYALGLAWTPEFANNDLVFDVEFYQTHISDTFFVSDILHQDLVGNAFKERINSGGALVTGVEANVFYRFTPKLSAEIGASFSDAQYNRSQEVLDGQFQKRFMKTPRWSGVAKLNYKDPELFDVFLGAIYTGPMMVVNQTQQYINRNTRSFLVFDASISRSFALSERENGEILTLQLGVKNLLDDRQKDLPYGVDRDTDYVYGPRFPRTFFVRASLEF